MPLRIPISRLVGGWHEPQVRPYRAALFEAVGILHGEHERERRKRSDPLDLAQELGFWGSAPWRSSPAAARSSRMRSVSEPICSKTGSRAGKSASGMCSEALLWKLLAGHLGKRCTEGFDRSSNVVYQLRAATDQRLPRADHGHMGLGSSPRCLSGYKSFGSRRARRARFSASTSSVFRLLA